MSKPLPFFESLSLNHLQNPIWVYDINSARIHWANEAALTLWEADSMQELKARNFSTGISDAVKKTLQGYIHDFSLGKVIDTWWQISPKDIDKRVFCRFSGIHLHPNNIAMLVEGIHSPTIDSAQHVMMTILFDNDGHLISANPPFVKQFNNINDWNQLPVADTRFNQFIRDIDQLQGNIDLQLNTVNGPRWHHIELKSKSSDANTQDSFLFTLMDIHKRKSQELTLTELAQQDPLTGLLNRRGLEQYLRSIKNSFYTLFFIDLDGFKPVNDTYGHQQGDLLLCQIANSLKEIHQSAVCARLGGDEFIFVLNSQINLEEKQYLAHCILSQISQPYSLKGNVSLTVTASIGMISYPEHGKNLQQLILRADTAMYQAKSQGRNRCISYTEGMEQPLQRHTLIVKDLEFAVFNQQLKLHYQPVLDLQQQRVPLVECLLRWNHPQLGDIPPLEIIEAADKTGKLAVVEEWVLNQACRDLPTLKKRFDSQLRVSVNVSAAHLSDFNFIERMEDILVKNNVCHKDVVFELTENTLLPMLSSEQKTLEKLQNKGYHIAIDNFGVGYSSLGYLSQIPASFVKIDKSFIKNISREPHTLHFIFQLCSKLGMLCIAEGVETGYQSEMLREQHIGLHQGFLYSKPVAIDKLKAPDFTMQVEQHTLKLSD